MQVFTGYPSSIDKRPPFVFLWEWITRQACDSSCFFFFSSGFLTLHPLKLRWVCALALSCSRISPWRVWSGAGAAAAAVERPAGKMMEEISIMVAYDAHVFSQLHDEDFLTGLVAISKPRSMVGGALHTALGLVFLFSCGAYTPTAVEESLSGN